MIPKFQDNQTASERAALIAKVPTRSVERPDEVEADISAIFSKCGMAFRAAEVGPPLSAPIGVYDAGEIAFMANTSDPTPSVAQRVSGPGFSHGLLSDLLEARAICKRLGLSMEAFGDEFRSSHLTCVHEILALGQWRHAKNVVRGFKTGVGKRNVDWKFESQGMTVLLEVKYRRGDWRRDHPETLQYAVANLFAEVADKFAGPAVNTWRIGHVTIVKPVDAAIARECESLVRQAPLDAMIVEPLDRSGRPAIFGSVADDVGQHLGGDYAYVRPTVIPYIYRRPSMRPTMPESA